MLLLIIAIAMFQMLSQGLGCWGWGGTAGNADTFPLSIDSCVLSAAGEERSSPGHCPVLVPVLIVTVTLTGVSLGGRNISPKSWFLFKAAQTVSFPPLPPALHLSGSLWIGEKRIQSDFAPGPGSPAMGELSLPPPGHTVQDWPQLGASQQLLLALPPGVPCDLLTAVGVVAVLWGVSMGFPLFGRGETQKLSSAPFEVLELGT